MPLPLIAPLACAIHLARGFIISPWLLPLAHLSISCSSMAHSSSYWKLFTIWPSMRKLLKMFGWYCNVLFISTSGFSRPSWSNDLVIVGETPCKQNWPIYFHCDMGSPFISTIAIIQYGLCMVLSSGQG